MVINKSEEYFHVASAVSNCVMACLWDEKCKESTCETKEHKIKAWRDKSSVILDVRHK